MKRQPLRTWKQIAQALNSHVRHYEAANEGPTCGQTNAVDTTFMRDYVTCKRCLAALEKAAQGRQGQGGGR